MPYDHNKGKAFWRDLDGRTLYSSSAGPIIAAAKASDVQNVFRRARRASDYPAQLVAFVTPRRAAWEKLARIQRETIADHFGDDEEVLQLAFEDFAQGVLVDDDPERVQNNDAVHMMDGDDGESMVGYHRWHGSVRAIQLFDPDPSWWERVDALIALAWGIQSVTKPQQQTSVPNVGITSPDLERLRTAWLGLNGEQRDRNFLSTQGAIGYHRDPFHPLT